MARSIYTIQSEKYSKKAKTSLVVLSNGQVFIDGNIEEIIMNAEKLGLKYEVVKGVYNPIVIKDKKKKNDTTGTD